MTSYDVIYDSFLSKISEDEWVGWTENEIKSDLYQILESAIIWFKFSRISLETNENGFINTLSNSEIQIISSYMKCEWLSRVNLSWENIKPMYTEKDFSQANMLDKLNKTLTIELDKVAKMESFYYRSINGTPFDYKKLAGENG